MLVIYEERLLMNYEKEIVSLCSEIDVATDKINLLKKRDLVAILQRQCKFSEETYGPGPRVDGVIAHITKELEEIRKDPSDITEWIDVCILAFDGAWRNAGKTPQEIYEAYVAKLEKNMARKWPDWRTADPNKPIEHVRGIHD